MIFIGDTHGKVQDYISILELYPDQPTVQVGDFGLGFVGNEPADEFITGYIKDDPHHRFIRGNHDNPAACRACPNWLPDGTVEGDVMFIGGAWSIDKAWRTQGFDWWEDEECSYDQLFEFVDTYDRVRPRVMVTHDAPLNVTEKHFVSVGKALAKIQIQTRTQLAFQSMFEIHQPELWVFGHWHTHLDVIENGTRFICLEECQTCEVDMDTLDVTY